jgi:hypothetical protein
VDRGGHLYVASFGSDAVYRGPAGGGSPVLYASGFDTPYFVAIATAPEPAGIFPCCAVTGAAVTVLRRRKAVGRCPP